MGWRESVAPISDGMEEGGCCRKAVGNQRGLWHVCLVNAATSHITQVSLCGGRGKHMYVGEGSAHVEEGDGGVEWQCYSIS